MKYNKKKRNKFIYITIILAGIIWYMFSNDYDRSKPTEFYEIARGVYVVNNAPYDTAGIKRVIEIYNLKTLPTDTIRDRRNTGRIFYRETEYMTRNFKQGEEYDPVYYPWNNIQDPRNHYDDRLMKCSYHIDDIGDGDAYFYYYRLDCDYTPDGALDGAVMTLYKNLDSLYARKKRMYGIE